ncbi:hypothetical protein E1200_14095 [Actinomadura sp. GC306]|uniref:hypothetical protein n=1 Tax=Actinomadura sp. GC306 TaxID=2530367 RepID=UPI0010539EB3|nr:hypothetical protein [Actinomadura sp. GC306]TDC67733.1 hypothetical protein E1200_14095 [Actinomadura sp. GC306]
MSEQPGDVLDEAAKLFDALMRRVGGGGRDRDADEPSAGRPGGGGPGAGEDVWASATAERPRIATGAPECLDCPVCRAIAVKREAGGDVGRHLQEAGQALLAAALDVVGAVDRTRDRTRDRDRSGASGGTSRNRPPEASKSPRAGRSERSERPDSGDAWSAATGGGPADIG